MFAGANIGGGGFRRSCASPVAHQSAERIGGGDRNRTDDPLLAKQVLSQLSYTPGGCRAATAPTGETEGFAERGCGSCTIGFRSLLRKPLSPRCLRSASSGGGPGRI